MHALGHFPAHGVVHLAAGEEADVSLREPVGARLIVRVTDAEGRPRPSAALRIADRRVFDVVEGAQRLDLYTDASGRRTLERVEPGRTTVTAAWGSGRGYRTLDLPDGETIRLHLVVK